MSFSKNLEKEFSNSERRTPFYFYDLKAIEQRAQLLKTQLPANAHVHFAMKANSHPDVLKVFLNLGFGVDVVSAGEMKRALECGFKASEIIFSGVGKTTDEIWAALSANISQLNVESLGELERIAQVARELRVDARVALRMNPDIQVDTHPYIRTGFRDNKFGLDFSMIGDAVKIVKANAGFLSLQGLTLHIGSQIREIEPFRLAIQKTLDLRRELEASGFKIKTFDVGGGLGIDYLKSDLVADEKILAEYTTNMKSLFKDAGVTNIYLEPGRFLVARFGYLVTEIQYVKETPHKKFVIVDTGMNHLLRPALYEAHHRIEVLRASKAHAEIYDVVGPICESADVVGYERLLPSDLKAGDRLVICDAGAYGAVMASDYNLRERALEYV